MRDSVFFTVDFKMSRPRSHIFHGQYRIIFARKLLCSRRGDFLCKKQTARKLVQAPVFFVTSQFFTLPVLFIYLIYAEKIISA